MSIRTVTRNEFFPEFPKAIKRRNVAAYARVSTGSHEQEHSLEAQKSFYEKYIQSHIMWNYIGLYVDDGISGLGTNKRDGFNRLINDALSGKIDLIVTKSISRFARNTVDTLTHLRKLKAAGVEVYFEKEDIFTFDAKGEFIISLMSSFAQEESRSISENVKWGKRKAFSDGRYSVGYSAFLGYDKGDKHPMKINEEEAKTVKLIYLLFLEGRTAYYTAKLLTELSIPTPGGKKIWQPCVIESILTNEKYKGDALLQKKYTTDFLTRKTVQNKGELPQYYVSNGHPAIIPRDIHEYVQSQREDRRRKAGRFYSSHNPLSGKIICSCGSAYGKRYANHNFKYPYTRWTCLSKDKTIPHSKPIKDAHLYQFVELALVELTAPRCRKILQLIKETCGCLPTKYFDIESHLDAMDSSAISKLMLTDEMLRILIKTITIDAEKKATVEFINGLIIKPDGST